MKGIRKAMGVLIVLHCALVASANSWAGERDAAGAIKAFRAELKRLQRAETVALKGAFNQANEAIHIMEKPLVDAQKIHSIPPATIFFDFSGFKKWYAKYEGEGKKKGEAALRLSGVGGLKAAQYLFKQLLLVNREIAKNRKACEKAKGMADLYIFAYEQRAVFEGLSLAVYHQELVRAVGKMLNAEVSAWLIDKGWKDAGASDKKTGSVGSRVALIDALASHPLPEAFAFLKERMESKNSSVRIAALEGIGKFAESHRSEVVAAALKFLKEEKIFCTKVPALRILQQLKPAEAIGVLVEILTAEVGQRKGGILCGHVLKTLRAVCGRDFGMNAEAWKAWFEKHKASIEKGEIPPAGEGDGGSRTDTGLNPASFFDIPTHSKKVVIIIDGTTSLIMPASWEEAKKHIGWHWQTLYWNDREEYTRKYETHFKVVKEETARLLEGLGDKAAFNLILLYEDPRFEACWPSLVPATPGNKAKALKMMDKILKGLNFHTCSHDRALFEAYRMAGLDRHGTNFKSAAADTFFLVSDGLLSSGPYMTPRVLVNAVRRVNRFRNVTVHTVQFSHCGAEAADTLKGIADATGGKYVWHKK
ncbi:MAG: HEAT repeat domain-containing protein [Planctomycetota bacterium]|jgi:hypothetical protein